VNIHIFFDVNDGVGEYNELAILNVFVGMIQIYDRSLNWLDNHVVLLHPNGFHSLGTFFDRSMLQNRRGQGFPKVDS
jgi:hypothetical protein